MHILLWIYIYINLKTLMACLSLYNACYWRDVISALYVGLVIWTNPSPKHAACPIRENPTITYQCHNHGRTLCKVKAILTVCIVKSKPTRKLYLSKWLDSIIFAIVQWDIVTLQNATNRKLEFVKCWLSMSYFLGITNK